MKEHIGSIVVAVAIVVGVMIYAYTARYQIVIVRCEGMIDMPYRYDLWTGHRQ